jgi:hypothetical protein
MYGGFGILRAAKCINSAAQTHRAKKSSRIINLKN